VLIWLAICAQIALIRNVALIDKNKKTTIKEGLEFAVKNFWPILLIVILLKLSLWLMFGLLGLVFTGIVGLGWVGTLIYISFFILFIVAALILAFLFKYQIFYILLKKKNFSVAIQSAWKLFVDNWLISLEMAALMLLVYLIGVILSAFLVTLFFAVPIIIVPYYFGIWPVFLKVSVSILAVVGVIATMVVFSCFITVFQWAAWVLLFQRLDTGEEVSGLERISSGLKQLPQLLINK
jgi:hypothetical protein